MQLESQVGFAAVTIASRNGITDITDGLNDKIDYLKLKIDRICTPANNIYINSCGTNTSHSQQSKLTQTDDCTPVVENDIIEQTDMEGVDKEL